MQSTLIRGAACFVVLLGVGTAVAEVSRAGLLRTRYQSLQTELARSPFRRPIHVVSAASNTAASADIHAILEFPFTTVRDTLSRPEDWCEILNLHLNVKACHASMRSAESCASFNASRIAPAIPAADGLVTCVPSQFVP